MEDTSAAAAATSTTNHNNNDNDVKMESTASAEVDAPAMEQEKQQPAVEATSATTTASTSATVSATLHPQNARAVDKTDRRVVVKNVFKYLDQKKALKEAQRLATLVDAKIEKVRKPPKEPFMVVTLEHVDMVEAFVAYINDHELLNKRGHRLAAKRATDVDDDWESGSRKRKSFNDNNNNDNNDDNCGKRAVKRIQRRRQDELQKGRRPITLEQVQTRMTPLWQLSAAEQVALKQHEMATKSVVRIFKEIKGRFLQLRKERQKHAQKDVAKTPPPTLYAWLQQRHAISLEPLVTVPTPRRNKVEFTFGYRYAYQQEQNDDNNNSNKDDIKMPDNQEVGTEMKVETLQSNDNTTPSATTQVKVESNVAATETTATTESTTTNDEEMTIQKEETTSTTTDKNDNNDKEEEDTRTVLHIPSVGFMAAGWSGGVSKPHGCGNISSEMCALVDLWEQFLKDSPLAPYDTQAHAGVWRYLVVRVSRRTRQCMLIVVHAPAKTKSPAENKADNKIKEEEQDAAQKLTQVWQAEKARMLQVLQSASLPVLSETGDVLDEPLTVTSIYLQEYDGLSNPPADHPVQHLFGLTALEEKLGNCTFRISPGAFFQVNTEGAEILYQMVMDRLVQHTQQKCQSQEKEATEVDTTATTKPLKRKRILFDVCCGTGTIGLSCLKEGVVDQVIGIDISEPAIEDAKQNAILNGFTDEKTTRFVASRAEHVMNKEIQKALKEQQQPTNNSTTEEEYSGSPIFLAVVDPAREGLHADVLRSLRMTEEIERIVYVSCNPTGSLIKDAGLLCSPPTKRYSGKAFRPTLASPVDMFPLTSHCEMIMVFDRVTEEDITKKQDDKKEEDKKGNEDKKGEDRKKDEDKKGEESPKS